MINSVFNNIEGGKMSMKFSERMGFKEPSNIIQSEGMNNDLRTSLWNIFYKLYLTYESEVISGNNRYIKSPDQVTSYIWMNFLKLEIDIKPEFGYSNFQNKFKNIFFDLEWYEVYDLLEFTVNYDNTKRGNQFKKACNVIFERELSAYRFIDNYLIRNVEDIEVDMIERTLKVDKYMGVKIHINESLKLISDKKSPDYRNSIKESISAVESICSIICGKDTASLGEALNIISKKNNSNFHPALLEGYKKIYGYTSNGDGIRHSLLEEDTLTYEDALYMLVSCSSFVNYLISKYEK